jgi:very-short-patch-repair endonuclease
MTDAERVLWRRLLMSQVDGHRFRRQAPFGNSIVDFVCHEVRPIVEVDGGQHAETTRYDAERTKFLESESGGYRVIRLWNNDVLQQTDAVMGAIRSILDQNPPPAALARGDLPRKGGG